MAKRIAIAFTGILVIASIFFVQDWLVQTEIVTLKANLKEQLLQQLRGANTVDRVLELSQSSAVYERTLGPVIDQANRLSLSVQRRDAIANWKREVHLAMEDAVSSRIQELRSTSEKSIEQLRTNEAPGASRMIKILALTKNLSSTMTVSTIEDEIKSLSESARIKDAETIKLIRQEGQVRIKKLKAMPARRVTAERVIDEIVTPVVAQIINLRQEDLRKSTWMEFQKKLNGILSKKHIPMANNRVKQFEKLFEPLAKDLAQRDRFAEKLIPNPEPPIEGSPTPLWSPNDNPADAESPDDGELYQ